MMQSMDEAWIESVEETLHTGRDVEVRGMMTKETLHRTLVIDTKRPVLTVPKRRLAYKFMAAEAYWILTGDDRVSTITPYNKNIAQFSDDGERFFGACGPDVVKKLPYVVGSLNADMYSRQSGLTIWRQNPPKTKDYPCTIAIWFNIRHGHLNCHVFMRSSDLWLGLPYDVFNFSMLTYLVCTRLVHDVTPGNLYLTAMSSHLYEPQYGKASDCIFNLSPNDLLKSFAPPVMWLNEDVLFDRLKRLRSVPAGNELRWWE